MYNTIHANQCRHIQFANGLKWSYLLESRLLQTAHATAILETYLNLAKGSYKKIQHGEGTTMKYYQL